MFVIVTGTTNAIIGAFVELFSMISAFDNCLTALYLFNNHNLSSQTIEIGATSFIFQAFVELF